MPDLVERLWNHFHELVNGDLRAVVRYGPAGYDARMRDDVRELYTVDDDRAIVDETIVWHLGLQGARSRFRAGAFEGTVRVFEDAWVVTHPDGSPSKRGTIVSIQRDGDRATISDVEATIDHLDEWVENGAWGGDRAG